MTLHILTSHTVVLKSLKMQELLSLDVVGRHANLFSPVLLFTCAELLPAQPLLDPRWSARQHCRAPKNSTLGSSGLLLPLDSYTLHSIPFLFGAPHSFWANLLKSILYYTRVLLEIAEKARVQATKGPAWIHAPCGNIGWSLG